MNLHLKMIAGYYIGDFHKDSKLQRKIENLKRYSPKFQLVNLKLFMHEVWLAELQGGLKHKKAKKTNCIEWFIWK